jgi:hypothetical protein
MKNKQYLEPIVEEYVKRCQAVRHPLNKYQVGLLKNVIREILNHNKDSPSQAQNLKHSIDKPIDIKLFLRIAKEEKLFHPHSLITMLQTYKYGEKGEDFEIYDKDALGFYNLIIKESEYKEYVTISREYGIKNLRLGNIAVLHSYLKAKNLVEATSEILLPPSDRNTRSHKKQSHIIR